MITNHKTQKERRSFLKKVAWSAPVLIALGQFVKPTALHAESNIPDPPFGAAATDDDQSQSSGNAPFESIAFDK